MRRRLGIPCAASLLALVLLPGPRATGKDGCLRAHVLVALADNVHQGIVPVRPKLGNGDDPASNLYWGARYGLKTHFRRSPGWKLVRTEAPPGGKVLERVLFRGRFGGRTVLVLAEAYRGRSIRAATEDFLAMAAGEKAIEHRVDGKTHRFGGGADLVAYVGHDGLMDFELEKFPAWIEGSGRRDAIVLACISRKYFSEPLRRAGARPLVWSTGLMAAEAYPLRAALEGWVRGEGPDAIRERAARAYAKYQKCSLAAARRLLVTGFEPAGQ